MRSCHSQQPSQIHCDGSVAFVESRHAASIATILSYSSPQYTLQRGMLVGSQTTESMGVSCRGQYRFPLKLAGHVLHQLARNNIPIEFGEKKPLTRLVPDSNALSIAHPAVSDLLNQSHSGCGGLIPVTNGMTPEQVVPHLLRGFRKFRCVLAVRTRAEVKKWREILIARGHPTPVLDIDSFVSKHAYCTPKVVVATMKWVEGCTREYFDLAVVPDVTPFFDMAGKWTDARRHDPVLWDYSLMRVAPAFGFFAPERRWSRGEFLRVLAYFGQILTPVPGPPTVREKASLESPASMRKER